MQDKPNGLYEVQRAMLDACSALDDPLSEEQRFYLVAYTLHALEQARQDERHALSALATEYRPAMVTCGDPRCVHSFLTWGDEIPPLIDEWHDTRAWPKCPEGHRVKLVDVERS